MHGHQVRRAFPRVVTHKRSGLLHRYLASFAAFVVVLAAPPIAAQQVDVIRGRVVGPDSVPIEGVRVTATSLSGAVNRSASTDRAGRFTITFPGGEGDYLVSFAAIGYAAKRFEVKRTADQDILVADAQLSRATELEAMRIIAPRDRVARTEANADVSGTERAVDPAALLAADVGDLAAMAASVPGVTLIPGADGDPSGFSVLGLGADQNNATLNGSEFGGSGLPRDAAISSSLVTSPYDVSRGGFSGAQFSIRTRPGSNFVLRTSSLNLDSPRLQWADRAGRSLGQEYANASLGGLVAGPIVRDQSFYTFSYQLGRRANPLQTLLNTDPLGLETAGIAVDSVARLLDILGKAGIPGVVGNLPGDRLTDQGMVLGTFDVAPSSSRSGRSVNVTVNGSWMRLSPVSALTTELPAHSGDRTMWNGGVQTRHSAYFGFGLLSESSLALNESQAYGTPYLAMTSGMVRVVSSFADGGNGVKNVAFGGSPSLGTASLGRSVSFSNQLSWFSANNRHRLKLSTELRRDDYDQDQTTNRLGTFIFNSLADLSDGLPSTFTRTLSPRRRRGGEYVGALALGDSYKRSGDLQIQYGIRVDGNAYVGLPAHNAEIAQLFGARNDASPGGAYVSPRLGFSWTYGTAPQIGGFEGAMRGPRAVVRGGIGVFQGIPGATLLGNAIDNTGLPGAIQQVTCAGPATPTPNWAGYRSNAVPAPERCADGSSGSPFASNAPNVVFFADNFAAPRSLRSNLQWSSSILGNRLNATAEATWSLNRHQAGPVDLNFLPTVRFAMSAEGERPVFVLPSSIDAGTGAIASRDARVSPRYNRVSETRSDLRSESRQFSLRISPVRFNTSWSWSLVWVYSAVREQARGFGANTGGDPLRSEWARAGRDSRHQVQYSFGYNFFNAVRVNWFGNVRSGAPFTPLVAGDVNGDGYENDRAFVFDPATSADPAFAAAMRQLIEGASGAVRRCLVSQFGAVAGRSSCQGPWTSSANLSVAFNPLKLGLPQRATLSFAVSNPLGAADLALHGERHLRGWGQSAPSDPMLYYVRGFDRASQRFRYDVNQRFGNTDPAFNTYRAPVTLTAMLRFDLGPTRERQALSQQLNSGRRSRGLRLNEALLRAIYGGTGGLVNPMAMMLRQADTLRLSGAQADSIATLNRWYVIRLDSIWNSVTKYLAALPDHFDEDDAYGRYRRAREASVDVLITLAPALKGLLSAAQRRRLPAIVASYLEPRYLSAIRSGTAGAGGSAFLPGGMMSVGGGSPGGRDGDVERTMIIVR